MKPIKKYDMLTHKSEKVILKRKKRRDKFCGLNADAVLLANGETNKRLQQFPKTNMKKASVSTTIKKKRREKEREEIALKQKQVKKQGILTKLNTVLTENRKQKPSDSLICLLKAV